MLDAVEAPARVAAAVAHLIRIVLKLFCLEAICLNIISTLNAKQLRSGWRERRTF